MAKRVDANQPEIVRALRAAGAHVKPLHAVGAGFPDLLVIYDSRVHLAEVKDGGKVPSKRKLTPDEQAYHATVLEQGGYAIPILETVEDALRLIGR